MAHTSTVGPGKIESRVGRTARPRYLGQMIERGTDAAIREGYSSALDETAQEVEGDKRTPQTRKGLYSCSRPELVAARQKHARCRDLGQR